MKKSIIYWALTRKNIEENLRLAKEAGFDAVELTFGENDVLNPNTDKSFCEKILKFTKKIGIEISGLAPSFYWSYPLTSNKKEIRQKSINLTVQYVKLASYLRAEVVLIIPGLVGADFVPNCEIVDYDVAYEKAQDSLQKIIPEAEKDNIILCVENVWNKFLLSPLEMRDFIDSFKSEYVKAYFDVGNVLLTGYPEQWIKILGKRIKSIHFKDFRRAIGNINGFVDLLEGDVDWKKVMNALRKIGYDSYCTAEVLPPYKSAAEALVYNTSKAMDYIFSL